MAKRILIIEDDLDILEILDIILLDEGYEVIPISKGLSAPEIELLHPDLILLDFRISGYDKTGAQICQELKSISTTSAIPVLLVSAESNLAFIANNCCADVYVSKPFDLLGIVAKVSDMLSKKDELH